MCSYQRLHRKASDSLFQQRKLAVYQWAAVGESPLRVRVMVLCMHCHTCGVSPPKSWHPCLRVRCLNLVSYFPWGSPRYYLIFLFTFFSSCITSFLSNLFFLGLFSLHVMGAVGKLTEARGASHHSCLFYESINSCPGARCPLWSFQCQSSAQRRFSLFLRPALKRTLKISLHSLSLMWYSAGGQGLERSIRRMSSLPLKMLSTKLLHDTQCFV